jgi:hypothetical protein
MSPAFTLVSWWTYFFYPEDEGDMFLRNVGWHSQRTTRRYIPEDCTLLSKWSHSLLTVDDISFWRCRPNAHWSPMDAGVDGDRSFSLLPTAASSGPTDLCQQPKALFANGGYHVVIVTNIKAKKMSKLKYAEQGSVTIRGSCGGVVSWHTSLSSQYRAYL